MFHLRSQSGWVRLGWVHLALVVVLSGVVVGTKPAAAQSGGSAFVISQIYTRGGEAGSALPYDYVEVVHRGAGYEYKGVSIQFASGRGTDTFGGDYRQSIGLRITPNNTYFAARVRHNYDVGPAQGEYPGFSDGNVDWSVPFPGGLFDAGGKVALVKGGAPLECNGGTDPCTESEEARILDLVGYGDTDLYEGSPAPAPDKTAVIYRKGVPNTVDTNNNGKDFALGVPNERNFVEFTEMKGVASASPPSVFKDESVLLTVAVQPAVNPVSTGITVYSDLREIGGVVTQPFYDDGTHGDVTAGDKVFSFRTTVRDIEMGIPSLYIWIFDAEGRANNRWGFRSISEVDYSYRSPATLIELGVGMVLGVGAASPNTLRPGDSTLLTLEVLRTLRGTYDKLSAVCLLDPITEMENDNGGTWFFDDGTHGDATAGDHIFSLLVTVDKGIADSVLTLSCSVSQDLMYSGWNADISLTIDRNATGGLPIQVPKIVSRSFYSEVYVPRGDTVTLSVEATGTGPLTYQWYRGQYLDTTMPLSTTSSLTVVVTETTRLWLRVLNAYGHVDVYLNIYLRGPASTVAYYPATNSFGFENKLNSPFPIGVNTGNGVQTMTLAPRTQHFFARGVGTFVVTSATGEVLHSINAGTSRLNPPLCNGRAATIWAGSPGSWRLMTTGRWTFTGTNGNDVIVGTIGVDTIIGNGGDDLICGGDEADIITGGAGADTVFGGAGADSLQGGPDNDRLYGEAGADTLQGGTEADTLVGGADADRLFGDSGADTLQGEAGDDTVIIDNADVVVRGGAGKDTLTARYSAAGVVVNMGLQGFEVATGSEYADTFTSTVLPDSATGIIVYGIGGNDRITGSAGADQLFGGAGKDTIRGEKGNDMLTGGADADAFSGGDGTDRATDYSPAVKAATTKAVGEGDTMDNTFP